MNISDYLNNLYNNDKQLDIAIDNEKKRRGIKENAYPKDNKTYNKEYNVMNKSDIKEALNYIMEYTMKDVQKNQKSELKRRWGMNIVNRGFPFRPKSDKDKRAVRKQSEYTSGQDTHGWGKDGAKKTRNKNLLKKPRTIKQIHKDKYFNPGTIKVKGKK